jgi:hypothetical protein
MKTQPLSLADRAYFARVAEQLFDARVVARADALVDLIERIAINLINRAVVDNPDNP